ncbi:MAG: PQQ-binding-like beta-propeller repeat protein [Pseudomonadota bacterium]
MRYRMPRLLRVLVLIVPLSLGLSACETINNLWFGEAEGPRLPGERVAVLPEAGELVVAPELAAVPITLPPPQRNVDWPVSNRTSTQSSGHLQLNIPFQRVWTSSIGSGSSSSRRLLNPPVVANGRVYAADAVGRVTALDTENGGQVWQVRVASPEENSAPLGGGVAYGAGLVYATTGFGEVVALDPQNGALVWLEEMGAPIRAAPMFAGNRVYAVSVENRTEAFDAATGAPVWGHSGLLETAGLLGGAAPSVGTGVVVVPYSSGEVYALRPENGRLAWTDSLISLRQTAALAALADIEAGPVIDSNLILAVSHSGRMAGIDLRSGARIWEQRFGGVQTPVVAGDTIFLVTGNAELLALERNTGNIRWVTELARWQNPEDRIGSIVWAGPVLADNSLILVSSEGEGVIASAQTGEIVGGFDPGSGTTVAPVIADGTLYILSDDGRLSAYR